MSATMTSADERKLVSIINFMRHVMKLNDAQISREFRAAQYSRKGDLYSKLVEMGIENKHYLETLEAMGLYSFV